MYCEIDLKEVVLMPFCVESVLMYHKLKRNGCKIHGFFDNNVFLASKQYDSAPIMLPYYSPEVTIIICHDRYMDTLISQIKDFSYKEENVIDWRNIGTKYNNIDVCNDVILEDYQKYCPREAIFDNDADGRNGTIKIKELRAFAKLGVKYEYGDKYHTIPYHTEDYLSYLRADLPVYRDNTSSPLFTVDNCDLKITDVCTLRCKYCSVMLDYPIERKETPLMSVIQTLNLWIEKIDFARRMNLLGGEPFTYSKLKELLEYIYENKQIMEKIGILYVYTNATILPSDEILELMRKLKVFVVVSGYTNIKTKIMDFVKLLNVHKINYHIDKMGDNWYDISSIVEYSNAQEKSKSCNATNCPKIENGKFYKCAFLLQAYKLGAIPYNEDDFIGIKNITKTSLSEYKASFTPGCGYCKGRNVDQWKLERVSAAQQLKEPREYKKIYEVNSNE